MTITDRNEPAASPAKQGLSPQARTAIAVGGLVACLLIGGGIIYWLLFASSPRGKRSVQVDPNQQAASVRTPVLRPPPRRDGPGIHKGDGEWIVRSAGGEMRVPDKAAGAADATFRFPGGLKLPPEQVSLLAGRFRILHDEAMAAEWKVTPQQVEKLKALDVGGGGGLNPSQPHRQELWALWTQFNGASGGQAKVDAQKKLIDKLEEVAKASFEPARQQYGVKIDQIKQILTPEQVTTITQR